MLKKIIFTGFFIGCSLMAAGQSNIQNEDDTPPEFERAYELLLSKRNIGTEQGNYANGTIVFDDSVYIKRLYALPTKMELVFNPIVKQQIEYYAGRRKNQVSYMLGEGKYYFPIFEEILDREDLPMELKYLPIIESALNPVARSRKGASGLWQFMAATGKMYDLEINSLVDERFDPYKSTNAAAKFLKFLYSKYGDWNLVIAAYNCGSGNVDKAIRKSGGSTDYWTIYPYLPKETRGYVPIFIAATYIMNYYKEHGINPAEGTKPTTMDSLMINRNLHFQQISDILNIPIADIRQYNPQFKSDMIPGEYKEYSLNLPLNKITAFIDKSDTIYAYKYQEFMPHRKVAGLDVTGGGSSVGSVTTHRVKKGDTLGKLANIYGVTSSQIKNWNGLSSNKLTVGRRLKIYRDIPEKTETPSVELASNTANNDKTSAGSTSIKSTSIKSTPINSTPAGSTKTGSAKTEAKTVTSYYKVRKGDTWAGIAKKNGATISEIKGWNNIKNNKLTAGKNLKIQKTEYIPVEEEIVKLSEPALPTVEIDSDFTADLFDTYLKKVETERDASSLPRIQIASTSDTESRERILSNDSKIIYHKVKIGETITKIAAIYKVKKKDIMSWNKLPTNMAKVGQRLLIHLPDKDSSALDSNTLNPGRENSIAAD
ncbi:MAG: LysM peptidoglycan-binding domain-containing protein [Prevotella sp.]|jgi:membrane-bound lytic murein transglycosylase D|nr:LysM peptidoglycan-binding domain-containing protein [Prevotella sp.]